MRFRETFRRRATYTNIQTPQSHACSNQSHIEHAGLEPIAPMRLYVQLSECRCMPGHDSRGEELRKNVFVDAKEVYFL